MLTGLCPAEHGVTWNDTESGPGDVIGAATIFELARASGLKTAAIFSKPKLRYLQKPGTLDFTGAPGRFANLMATETVEATVRYLKHERPNLLFVHLAEPDYAGHTIGWMSSVYGWAVRRSDAAVRRILEEAESAFGSGNYTVILTADHGGHDRTHGTEDPRDMTIPWIAWGLGVLPGNLSSEPIQTIDTAATALWLLGVEPPEEWSGRPIRAAFVGGEGSADLEEVQDRCAHLL
jgi:arylsulfatase A-like enzyme